MITDRMKQRARDIPIVGYLQALGVKGRTSGRTWQCRSPFRPGEKKPSFHVYLATNTFCDYGAPGVHGDTIDLVRFLYGYSFVEGIEHLLGEKVAPDIRRHKVETPPVPEEPTITMPSNTGQMEKGKKTVQAYFEAVGLPYTPNVAFPMTRWGINWICFPTDNVNPEGKWMGGECRGFRHGPKGLIIPLSARRATLVQKLPWGLIRDEKNYLITESITDALASPVLGEFFETVSLFALNGVNNYPKIPAYIKNKNVWLALDNDGTDNGQVGQKTAALAEEILKESGCKVAHVTAHVAKGVKDLLRLLHLETKHQNAA